MRFRRRHDAGRNLQSGGVPHGWDLAQADGWHRTSVSLRGFDVYYTPKAGADAQLRRHSPGAASIGGTDEDVFVAAQDFLEYFGQEKFFLYLHLMDLHQYVFDDDADAFGPTYSDAYDKAIDWTDR